LVASQGSVLERCLRVGAGEGDVLGAVGWMELGSGWRFLGDGIVMHAMPRGTVALGQSPLAAVASGRVVVPFVFSAGMTAAAYVKRQAQ
jgi:hypothetical protein